MRDLEYLNRRARPWAAVAFVISAIIVGAVLGFGGLVLLVGWP